MSGGAMSQRFEGHSLEDALNNAAAALGVERYQLTHSVLVEKRGFLGGIKRVVIEAEVNEGATPPAEAPVVASVEAPRSSPPPARESRGGDRGGRGGGGRGRGPRRDDRGGDSRRGRGRSRHEHDDLEPGDFQRFAVDAPEQPEESQQAGITHAWCEKVLSLAKLDAVVRTEENETQIIVRLYGGDAKQFTEHHGELLDAFQVLANKALVGRKIEKEIELDCEEFKERRMSDLERRAHEIADRVREDGHEQLLPAMSPIERRIVHLALQDDKDVTTESRGDGFYKRVAVILRPNEPADSRES